MKSCGKMYITTFMFSALMTVPLTGFGYLLANGVRKAVVTQGWLGVLTGGLSAAAGGIAAAVVFAVLAALVFRPGDKR